MTSIWEYDLTLSTNRVSENTLDVVATVHTLAIKMQCSGQCIEYFWTLQGNCGIDKGLLIPLHSNVYWGSAYNMLAWAYNLHQPINLFVSSVDEFFGPITSIQHHGTTKQILWTAFALKPVDWECVEDICTVILDVNDIQEYFSGNKHPTLCLDKISKYYNKLDQKPVYVLSLVLHPYYKMNYIKMAWSRAEEQEKEKEQVAGNIHAKNWYNETIFITTVPQGSQYQGNGSGLLGLEAKLQCYLTVFEENTTKDMDIGGDILILGGTGGGEPGDCVAFGVVVFKVLSKLCLPVIPGTKGSSWRWTWCGTYRPK
ncbi:hypothetical protein JVU11DRAFT_4225 [Chiua virens]|nr:hypothetical protein JVU11DRAFT_4225 [Chiua virens]